MTYELSIIIPARNEIWLQRTLDDVLAHKQAKTQIIVGLDGYWPHPPLIDHPDVVLVYYSEVIGQRAMITQCVKLSNAKYIMKLDAHCAVAPGFDIAMLQAFVEEGDNVVIAPLMRNLHVFNWQCPNGHTRYQGPSGPCKDCGEPTDMDVIWNPKTNPQSTSYCFDAEPHFQYFNQYKDKQIGELVETMSLQGSCFMCLRDKYWQLNLGDDAFGSWGSQGIQVACSFWLSGGRVLVNKRTWYAHCFRTQGGDFSFPYEQPATAVTHAKHRAKQLLRENGWPQQVHPSSWLIEKFWPVPGWSDTDLAALKGETVTSETQTPTRGILYYSNNQLNMKLARECRRIIALSGLPVTSVTLKPTNFGRNIVYKGVSSYKTMYAQILTGLEAMTEEIVYFCEHDTIYHPDHFNFIPTDPETWYYNGNYWFLRASDGFAVHYDVSPLSGLVVYRESAIKHFKERLALIDKQGFGYYMGFEPFTHKRIKWDYWCQFEVFLPDHPNVDIAHTGNLTRKRWSQDKFRKQPKFWEEGDVDHVPGWNNLRTLVAIG